MSLTGGGTDTGGSFDPSTGATIDLNDNTTPTMTGTYTGSGGGTVGLAGGAIAIGAGGATFDFPSGMFQWSAGSIDGPGVLAVSAGSAMTIAGNGEQVLSAAVLNNSGTIVDSGNNTLFFENSSTVNNLSGGAVDVTSTADLDNYSGTNAFNNQAGALVDKSASTGTLANTVPFNNQGGTIEVDAGTLSLAGGGVDTGGTFNVAQGATLNLTGGSSPTLTGSYSGGGVSGLGQGTVALANGTVTIGAAGATLDFPAGLLQWSGGTIQGDGSSGSPSVLANTGAITLTGSGNKDLYNALTLNNSGTIVDTGSGGFYFNMYAVLNNLSGGLVNLASTESIYDTGSTTGNAINNESGATFEGSGASGASVAILINIQGGTVAATQGTLSLTGGGTDTGGSFDPSTGATIDLNDNTTPTMTGTYTGSGGGTVGLAGGGNCHRRWRGHVRSPQRHVPMVRRLDRRSRIAGRVGRQCDDDRRQWRAGPVRCGPQQLGNHCRQRQQHPVFREQFDGEQSIGRGRGRDIHRRFG